MKKIIVGDRLEIISLIGQGTGFGGFLAKYSKYNDTHVASIKYGIELGMNFIDTAEEYGIGEAEIAVGTAIKGIREKTFIATKVSSDNLEYLDVIRSAECSLKRLKSDYIDLYQIHWPNPKIPLEETMRAITKLLQEGKIRYVGVCNFNLEEIKKAKALMESNLLFVQAEFNLVDRTVENEILPFCQNNKIITIAYSPLIQGRITDSGRKLKKLEQIAQKYEKTSAQIVLNWLISHIGVIAIPQSTNFQHIKENAEVADFEISKEDNKYIGKIFTPKLIYVSTEQIRIQEDGEGNLKVYKTIEEALSNKFGMVPSPVELATSIQSGEVLKPIKVRKVNDSNGVEVYHVVEGRLRYWAWVIAYKGAKPIPAILRD